MMLRREFLGGATAFTAASLCPVSSLAGTEMLDADDDLFVTTLLDSGAYDAPLLNRGPSEASALGRRVKAILSSSNPSRRIIWAPDMRLSPDFRHLVSFPDASVFKLTHKVMERICTANGFAPTTAASRRAQASARSGATGSTKVLIGIRGCIPVASTAGSEIELMAVQPDHIALRCMIGVWDIETRQFQLFRGSTVPDQGYVLGQALNADKVVDRLPQTIDSCIIKRINLSGYGVSNMIPTGQFSFVVGTHLGGSWIAPERRNPPMRPGPGARDPRQPAAFRQDASALYPTLRVLSNERNLFYSVDSHWDMDPRSWGVNIHAAYKPKPLWGFNSAGCQVVAGHYSVMDDPNGLGKPAVEAIGDYGRFRVAAGLSAMPDFIKTPKTWADSLATTDDGRRFYSYLLLTGREVALHASATLGSEERLKRLRFGSSGPTVVALCKALTKAGFRKRAPSAEYDHSVACDVLRWQRCFSGAADGIVTPEMANALGFTL